MHSKEEEADDGDDTSQSNSTVDMKSVGKQSDDEQLENKTSATKLLAAICNPNKKAE